MFHHWIKITGDRLQWALSMWRFPFDHLPCFTRNHQQTHACTVHWVSLQSVAHQCSVKMFDWCMISSEIVVPWPDIWGWDFWESRHLRVSQSSGFPYWLTPKGRTVKCLHSQKSPSQMPVVSAATSFKQVSNFTTPSQRFCPSWLLAAKSTTLRTQNVQRVAHLGAAAASGQFFHHKKLEPTP